MVPESVGAATRMAGLPEVDRGVDGVEGFRKATTASAILFTSPSDSEIPVVGVPEPLAGVPVSVTSVVPSSWSPRDILQCVTSGVW